MNKTSTFLKLGVMAMLCLTQSVNVFAQTTLISPTGAGGFENGATFAANGWTEVNGATNNWFVGTVSTPSAGTNAAYVSDNVTGTTYNYTTTVASTVHFYRDVTFPAGETNIVLSFKWKVQGESSWDYVTVYSMPTSNTPTVNNPAGAFQSWLQIPVVYPGAVVHSSPPNLNLQGTYQTQTICLPAAYAGTTRRLVFMWSNDGSGGTQPPGSIDEISLVTSLTPTAPANSPTALTLTPTSVSQINGSFTAAAGAPDGYLTVRYPAGSVPTNPVNGTTYVAGAALGSGTVVSSSALTTFSATGLTPSTAYDFYVYAYTSAPCASGPLYKTTAPAFGTASTLACPSLAAGTYTVGPTGTYASLTAVTAALANGTAGPVIFELQPTYLSAVETFPITFLGSACPYVGGITIRPQTGAAGLSITSANATGTININGASNITFDGRAGGVGVSQLTIENTSVTGYALQFINSARFNTLKYCTVKGVNTSNTSGVIVFSTAVGLPFGNSNNTIDNCDIRDGATTPTNLIWCSGTLTNYNTQNNNITISNCLIHDWFNATATTSSAAINLSVGGSDWTITNNSFYQSVARTFTMTTATEQGAIFINSGNLTPAFSFNFNISNNFIGGSAALCGGAAYTWTGGATGTITPRMIRFTSSIGAFSNISNNTIANISLTTSTTATGNSLISHLNGNVNINGNTIGSQSTTGNITFALASTSTAPFFVPISTGTGASVSMINITNNNIGSILVTSPGGGAVILRVIYAQPVALSKVVITNNIVGGTVANSIEQQSGSATAQAGQNVGITILNPTLDGIVSNNTIRNLTQNNLLAGGFVCGINLNQTGGRNTVTGNTISNLTTNGTNIAINNIASIVGIAVSGSLIGGSNISNNTIFNLTNTNTTVAGFIQGMYFGTALFPQQNTIISRNFIHSINVASITGGMAGINLPNTGNARVFNNMVRLGVDANGASITTSAQINGIIKASSGSMSIFANSVFIGGTGVASNAVNSFAFRRTASPTTGNDTIMNNIFYNARSNASGTGKHYAAGLNANATLAEDFNDLYVDGVGGVLGLFVAADQATLAAWQTAANQDWNSSSGDPKFINPNGTSANVDLHIQAASATVVEQGGYNFPANTQDYDSQARSGLTPVDIGADAGNFLLLDKTPPAIYYSNLTYTCGTGDRTINGVNIIDATGVPLTGALRPRIYYKKNAGAYFSQPGTNTGGTTFNSTWDFTIVAADMGGLVAGDVVSYYIIAQDNAAPINIGSNAGGAVATDVNTVTVQPTAPYTYSINATSLNGTYTVGVGGAYTTLTAAVTAYNTACITGPVLFSLTDANYPSETFPIQINANPYASSVNTLTIKPAPGVTATITGTTTLAPQGIIVLNGADWVTIDGSNGNVANTICPSSSASRDLTITNLSTSTASAVIWLQAIVSTNPVNGVTNNTIKNVNLVGSGNTGTLFGIGMGSATTGISTASLGSGNNNNSFINNNISKTTYGIYTQGPNLSNKNTGNVINQNLINTAAPNNCRLGGIFTGFEDGIQINGNNISELAATSDMFGIALGMSAINNTVFTGNEVTNATVTNNKIGTVVNTGTFAAAGITIANAQSGTNTIANNMISGVFANGTGGDFAAGIFAGGGPGSTTRIYYNSVSMSRADILTGSSPNYALAIGGVQPVIDVRNNILSSTGNNGTGSNVAIGLAYVGTTGNYQNLTSNFNDLYATGTGSAVGVTGSLASSGGVPTAPGTFRTTLADWQTETGRDGNSFNVLPNYTSGTDLHLTTTTNQCLDGGATPIAGFTTDIDCQTRNASIPDIGADEFTNPNLTIGITETSGIANNDGIICSGAAAQLTANGGGTYQWSVGGFTTASIVVLPNATTTFTVTVTNGTCTDVMSVTITVNPLPTAFLMTGGGAYCAGGPGVNISLTGSQLNFSYQLFLAGNPVGAPVIGTGNAISFGNQTAAGTYSVIATNPATGCTNSMANTAVVVINPTPTITPALTQPLTCVSADGAINLTISGPAGPYTYNWSTPNGSGLVNGQEDQTGLTVGTYFVTVTATPTGCTNTASITLIGPGGCSVCPTIGSITSSPVGAVCEGTSFTLTAAGLVDMGSTYGIIFKYSAVALGDPYVGGTVLATVANGALTGGGTTATANVSIPAAGTYFIYAILSPSPLDAGCRPSQSLSKTINPIPSATASPTTQTICSATAITTIVWSGPVPNTTFNWTRDNNVNLTGIAANGSGNVTGSLTNNTNVPQTTVFTVTPTANGCTGNSLTTATVIVNPRPNAVATPATQTICSGNTTTAIVLSGNVSGSTFSWTRDNVATVTGIAANGTGNIPASALTNTTNAPITVTFTITATANGCAGTAITATILVNPTPATFALTGGGVVCNTDNIGVPVGLSGSQLNVSYQLRLNGNPIGAPVAGTGAAISFGPQLAGTYTVLATHTQGGCTSVMTGTITIGTFNCNVTISDPCVCLNNATTLTNGQFGETIKVNAPDGQVWTVTAINGLFSQFSPLPPSNPFPIPVGTNLVILGGNMYTLTGVHVDAIGYTITVTNNRGTSLSIGNSCQYPNPSITTAFPPEICLFSDPIPLTGNPGDANIVSQTFRVNGVVTNTFNPAQGTGQYTIVYTVDGGVPKAFGPNDPGCIQSVSTIVNVVVTPSNLVCNDQVYVSLDADCTEDVLPDDVLEGTYGCYDDYIVELDKTIPYGNGPWVPGTVNAADIGKNFQVRITHLVSGVKCWGNLKVEDKLAPVLNCVDFNIPCNTVNITPNYLANTLGIAVAIPTATDCQNVTWTYLDSETAQDCATGLTKIVFRKWTATDGSGNSSTCIQNIGFIRPTLSDVVAPPDYDGIDANAFSCEDNVPLVNGHPNPTPDWIESQGLQGHPYIFGLPSGCSINWEYHDFPIYVCDGTIKYRREWTIIDWCIGDGFIYNQIIKVIDDSGPGIDCPADLTVSTDPFACCATINLPDVIVEDNCSRINNISGMIVVRDQYTGDVINMVSIGGTLTDFPGNNHWDLDTLAAFGYTACLPAGNHTVTYIAEDDCGNTSQCNFNLVVRDYTPPVAACDETTTVAIGVDDPFDCYGPAGPNGQPLAQDACQFAGVTWVKATTFDDGSYDNCNAVKFTIRRMSPYTDCILGLNSVRGALPCDATNPTFPSEFERAISEQDSIKFYCCEVGTTQTVILAVYQVDVNGNIMVGQDGSPIKNECMIQVEVQDKVKPTCLPPAAVTVNCENFDPSLWAYGKPVVADNCCLDTSKVYQGQCGLTHSVSYTLFDTVCNKGTITRTFRAFDCHGFSSQCTQRVVVTYEQDYFIKFPNDAIVTVCDGTGIYDEPKFFGEDCELLGVSYEDEVFTVVPDACFKIERTWTIINWCTYNPNAPCIYVDNPNPNPIANASANLPGPTVSACGTPAPWAPTVVKINPTDPTTTNFCTYWQKDANCYKYKQIIKVIDGQAPTGTYTVPTCANSNWFTPNNNQLWNESYWWDNGIGTHDLCEEPTDLCITGNDACSGSNINIEYLLFLDLDGDGIMETVVNSVNTGIAGLGWNNVLYNNLNTPNFSGGTPRNFDERPVPGNQKYGFAIQETVAGNNKTACVRWNTQQQQNTYVTPELPHGTHKIKWFLTDGCGNNKEYEYTFTVKDCKAPTVVCLNGLSVNIMPTGMITLWASDFLQYTEDNCTPAAQLKIGIRKCGQGTGFPVDNNGNPITSVNFLCTELGTQCVELWSIDAAGNADYCETYVIVQDNLGNCPSSDHINVAGALKTEMTDGVEEATVNINGTSTFTPPYSYFDLTDADGVYQLVNNVPLDATFTIAPEKDDNPLNGVTTYDLVLISKHILGIEPLNTPYKMIAADANKSGSITTFDIVELRKLILGIYTELPNNTSWRFVDKAFVFPNANNPFQTVFPETKSVANAMNNQMDKDFAGVKIGDVNNTAVANATMQAEERTAGTAIFDLEDRSVKAGEEFDVTFKSAQELKGFQFTATLNGLKAISTVNAENVSENNFNLLPENAMAVSIDGAQSFTVRFRAEKAGKLSEMLGVSGAITRAEAYPASAEASAGKQSRLDVAFRFDGKTISGVGFELYQNQPNPFVNKTFVGFYLPEAAEATLSVYDETGRVVYQQKGQFAKGENSIALDRALINTTGILYYKLETATDSATKKMIQAK